MRSFAVIAGFAAAANAYAYGYPEAYNTTSSTPAAYEASKTPAYPVYPAASSSAPAYAASSSAPAYPVYPASSKTPEYPAYPVSSKAPEYPAYTTTKIVTGLTTVCPEPTTVTYGTKTYTVSKSTTLIDVDCEYTTTYAVKPTPTPSPVKPVYSAAKPSYAPPAYSAAPPPAPVKPYPSASNGTVPVVPAPSGVAKPSVSATKPATPEFTGAAAQAGVGLLAVIGAVAAFL